MANKESSQEKRQDHIQGGQQILENMHKYGLRIPHTVKESIDIDKANGDTLWWDTILQEMKNIRTSFEAYEGKKEDLPPGYQHIKYHMMFDIKLGENFRRKAQLVGGGHTTTASY